MFESYRLYRKLKRKIRENRARINEVSKGYQYHIPLHKTAEEVLKVKINLYDSFTSSSDCVNVLPQRYKNRLLKYAERQYKISYEEQRKRKVEHYLESM